MVYTTLGQQLGIGPTRKLPRFNDRKRVHISNIDLVAMVESRAFGAVQMPSFWPGVVCHDSPVITAIIPTYRRPKLLKRAIASVLNQTYPLLQVQVYDNASGDETKEVVNSFALRDSRLKYHCHTENIGMMANYEYALKEVKTPYFSILSDDDLIFPWFYEVALQGLQKWPEAALSACSAMIMSEKGKIVRVPLDSWAREGYFSPEEGLLEMISKYPIPTCILFQQRVIDEFPIDKNNQLTWDCDFLLQISAKYPIFINKRPCGIFLHHDSCYSNTQHFEKWEHSYYGIIKRIEFVFSLSYQTKKIAIERIKNDVKLIHSAFVIHYLFNKKFKEAHDCALIFRKNYGFGYASLLLLALAKSCICFPFFIHLLCLIRSIKRMSKKEAYRSYLHYAQWVKW
jgi:glycosyltransferase involved in cell wall biosynthesis